MKRLYSGLSAVIFSAMMPGLALAGDDLSVSVSVDYVTDYVFRGVSLADSAIQPGVEAAIGDFTIGAWFSTGIGDTSIFAGDELDLYASYSFGLSDKISANVGATYYHYPQGGSLFETNGGSAGTYEVYGGLGFDMVLSPSVTAYYDFTLEALTLEGGLSHSVEVADKTSLDLGLTAGLVDGDGADWEYGTLSAALGYSFTKDVSAYIGANYTLTSSDNEGLGLNYKKALIGNGKGDLFWLGAGVAAGF